jgi:hypothetical protein
MLSDFAVNKYLHTVASGWIFINIYFNNMPLHVSSRLAAHHQEDQLCINSNWYSRALCWLAAGSQFVYTELILLMISSKPTRNM